MITNDNYHEYFLLYVDNELSAPQREAVEEWVAANPDLREEWEALLQCRLLPEQDLVFRDKHSLLRGEDFLLLYIDGELDSKDRSMVEVFLQQHPSKMQEFEQLRQTVSVPDMGIRISDKASLYRKEKDRRVIVLYRSLIGAAAAAVLSAVALTLIRGDRRSAFAVVEQAPVQQNKKVSPAVTSAASAALYPTDERERAGQDSALATSEASALAAGQKRAMAATLKEKKLGRTDLAVAGGERKTGAAREAQRAGGVAVAAERAEVVGGEVEKKPAAIKPVVAVQAPAEKTEQSKQESRAGEVVATGPANNGARTDVLATAGQGNISREQSSFATQALLLGENEKEIIAAAEPASPGKSKLRGFFRKVTRNLGKTADRDNEGKREVLIGAFQVAVN